MSGRSAIGDELLEYFDAANNLEDLADLVLRHLLRVNEIAEKYLPVFRKRFIWADGEKATLESAAAEIGVTRERVRQVEKQFEVMEIDLLVPPRLTFQLLSMANQANSEEEFWELLRSQQLFLGDRVWPLEAVRQLVELVGGEIISEEFSSRIEQISEPSDLGKYRAALRKLRSGMMGWIDLRTVEIDLGVSHDRARWLIERSYAQVLGSGPLLVVNKRLPGPFLTTVAKVFKVTDSPTVDDLFLAINRESNKRPNSSVGTEFEKRMLIQELFGEKPAIPSEMGDLFENIELLRHEIWFTQIFRSATYGLLHRDQIIELALGDGYPVGSIGAYLTYNPVVAPFGESVFGLIGLTPTEEEIRFVRNHALDTRPDPDLVFEYLDAQELEVSLNLNFSSASGGALAISKELQEAIGREQFGVCCSCGSLDTTANLKISSGFLSGIASLVVHAMREHGQKSGNRVNIVLNFEELKAELQANHAP